MEPVAYRVADFCRIYVISKASFYREVQAGRLHILKRGRRSLRAITRAWRRSSAGLERAASMFRMARIPHISPLFSKVAVQDAGLVRS